MTTATMEKTTRKTDSKSMVVAVFRDRVNGKQAYDWLVSRGYSDAEINVLMSAETRRYYETYKPGDKDNKIAAGTQAAEGMATGGTIGAAVGATAAAIAAIGTAVAIPGLGWVVAGPILAGLAGAGAGAVTGGLIGGLIGLGIPESNAKAYEEALKNGGVVVGVVPHEGDTTAIQKEFEKLHGENVVCCA